MSLDRDCISALQAKSPSVSAISFEVAFSTPVSICCKADRTWLCEQRVENAPLYWFYGSARSTGFQQPIDCRTRIVISMAERFIFTEVR